MTSGTRPEQRAWATMSVGVAGAVPAPVGPEAGAFEHHDQRDAVGDRDLGDPVALRVRRRADRAGLHREVLGRDHHRTAVDATRAHHDRVGGRLVAADERAELLERTRVEEHVDAGANIELARVAVLAQPFVAAHRARRRAALLEILEDVVPIVRAGHEICRSVRLRDVVTSRTVNRGSPRSSGSRSW